MSGATSAPPRLRRVVAAVASGYALGLFPSAAIAARLASGGKVDLRSAGSGNPGAMNALRVLGRAAGIVVSVADIAKGSGACLLGRALAGDAGAHLAGVAAVAGHCYPAPARCRGGLGVATSFGQCLATFPVYAPVDVAIAVGAARLASPRHRVTAALVASSAVWVGAGAVSWRRGLPNLWGPRPSALLPLANLATCGLIASRGVATRKARRAAAAPTR